MPRTLAFSVVFVCLAQLAAVLPPAGAARAADEVPPPAAAAAAGPQDFAPAGWSMTLHLPDTGNFGQPGDAGWSRDDLDFLWLSQNEDYAAQPVYQIDGSTIGKSTDSPAGATMTDEEFSTFYDNMLADLSTDQAFTVIDSAASEEHKGRRWQRFHITERQTNKDDTGQETTTELHYYSYFALDADGTLRLVNFYYEPAADGAEQEQVRTAIAATLDAA